MTTAPGIAELVSLGDPAVIPNPYPLLRTLREASPFPEFDGKLIVFGRYGDCSRILRDPRSSSERGSSLLSQVSRIEQDRRRRSFLSLDPPDHTRLRRLVSQAFTPRVIARLAPRITEVTDELLDAAAGTGSIELVSQLAYLLPVRIISELLGVPAQDHSTFAGWSAKLVHSLQPSFGAPDPVQLAETEQASDEFGEYFTELIARRRATPADDLLTKLIKAEDEGQRLSLDELLATCVLLLVAGHETTVGLISNAMLALMRNPDQFRELAADPTLAGQAVEETLRYDPPVQITARIATGGMSVAGQDLPDGALLLLLLAATGRDDAVFSDPDVFDLGRENKEHLAFAAGPHFCLGAPLARLEATIALQSIATRVISPVLDENAEGALSYKSNFNLRGPERLMLTFTEVLPPTGEYRPMRQS